METNKPNARESFPIHFYTKSNASLKLIKSNSTEKMQIAHNKNQKENYCIFEAASFIFLTAQN